MVISAPIVHIAQAEIGDEDIFVFRLLYPLYYSDCNTAITARASQAMQLRDRPITVRRCRNTTLAAP